MPTEQRCEELIFGLTHTAEENVTLDFSHLAQVVGMQAAEDMAEGLVETRQVINPVLSPRSALKATFVRSGYCQVPRQAALEACLRAKAGFTKAKIDAKVQTP